jgi:hypothetical protein
MINDSSVLAYAPPACWSLTRGSAYLVLADVGIPRPGGSGRVVLRPWRHRQAGRPKFRVPWNHA